MRRIIIPLLVLSLLTSCAWQPNPPPLNADQQTSLNPAEVAATQAPSPSPTPTPSPTPSPTPTPTPTPTPDPTIRIQLAGDILLHTKPVNAAKTGNGYDFTPYFSEIAPYLDGDLRICNMESPVDTYGENRKLSSYPRFNVPLEILSALKTTGFDVLVTANNHSYDQGWEGLVQTRKHIQNAGLLMTGTNETEEQFHEYCIVDIDGIRVGIIAYSQLDNGLSPLIPKEKLPFAMRRFNLDMADVEKMAQDMENCREAGAELIVLSLHWGAEYLNGPNEVQKQMARALCEQGADIIMGNHSHSVQPIETVDTDRGERVIIYSLGNFFADQNDMETPKPRTQYGMLVTVTATKSGDRLRLSSEALPTHCERYKDASSPNGWGYRIRPALPDSAAYTHVSGILGDAVMVSAPKAEVSDE